MGVYVSYGRKCVSAMIENLVCGEILSVIVTFIYRYGKSRGAMLIRVFVCWRKEFLMEIFNFFFVKIQFTLRMRSTTVNKVSLFFLR